MKANATQPFATNYKTHVGRFKLFTWYNLGPYVSATFGCFAYS